MDENLLNQTTEEYDRTEEDNIQERDIPLEDVEPDIDVKETTYDVVVDTEEEDAIDLSESMGWVSGDARYHDSLLGVDSPNQHPITAISHLREELDEIERLKTVYSDKVNVANYYKWNDATYDECGYFVSLVPNTSTIKICDGSDIFGVVTNDAAFVGNQHEDIPRDNSYGIVVTSGIVDIRCELDVEVGDCVVSNSSGYAKKSESSYGYKVLAKETKNGVEYAVILLGIQADITDAIGANLSDISSRLNAAESNIVSAINVANDAYKKASEIDISNLEISNKVDNALGVVDRLEGDVANMGEQVANSAVISAQARAIAESAATSATSMKEEAVEKANEALADTYRFRDELLLMDEGITEMENQITLVVQENSEQGTAIAGIRTEVTDHDSKINNLVSWQGDTNTAMARIEQKADANGAYIQSTVSNMDKYAVGPHSQAYGFTRKQAQSVLEVGMIYVPTKDEITEEYIGEEDLPTYSREFSKGYLYRWGEVSDGYGWITVDRDYSEDKLNTSAPAVYFVTTLAPTVADSNNFGYWYTNGDTLTGTAANYEPYTLYKWESYEYEDGYNEENEDPQTDYHWVAVATLAGNSSNRAVSQVRQDANSIKLDVTNVKGDLAEIKMWAGDDFSAIQDTVTWKTNNSEAIATTIQRASDSEAYIAQVASVKNPDGTVNAAASIVTAVNDSNSSVVINADHIKFEGFVSFASKDDVKDVQDSAIYDTKVEYALSSSSTEFIAIEGADGQWSTAAPAWRAGAYMWQRTTITKGDGSTDGSSDPTCIQGANGNDAPKVKSEEKQFHTSDSNTTAPDSESTDWDTVPMNYEKGKYLWTRSVYTMDKGDPIKGDAYLDKNFTTISQWCKENYETYIDGANIYTGSVTTEQLNSSSIKSHNYPVDTSTKEPIVSSSTPPYSTAGTFLNLTDGAVYSKNFVIEPDGDVHLKGLVYASGGKIGGWDIDETKITKTTTFNTLRLPTGYTEVEYIKSDGETAYIDAGFMPDDTIGFDVTFEAHSAFNTSADANGNVFGAIFGARTASEVNDFQLSTYSHNTSGTLRFGGTTYDAKIKSGGKITCSLRNKIYTNSGYDILSLSGNFATPYNLTIFALNQADTKIQYGEITLYALKFYDGDVIIRDFVPAYNSSGKIGLYDLVTKEFYQGVGTFTKGDDIVHTTKNITTTLDASTSTLISNNIEVTGGRIGGWAIHPDALSISNNNIFIRSSGIRADVCGETKDDLILKVGNHFGVSADGTLYAKNADITGTLNAGVGSKIGNFEIDSDSNLVLSGDDDLSNSTTKWMAINNTYNGVLNQTVITAGTVQARHQNMRTQVRLDCTDGNPLVRWVKNGTNTATLKLLFEDDGTHLYFSGDADLRLDNGLGVKSLNNTYHSGITGQIRVLCKDANGHTINRFLRIDNGIITGISAPDTPYDGYTILYDAT